MHKVSRFTKGKNQRVVKKTNFKYLSIKKTKPRPDMKNTKKKKKGKKRRKQNEEETKATKKKKKQQATKKKEKRMDRQCSNT